MRERLSDMPAEVVVWTMDNVTPRHDLDLVVPPYMSDPQLLSRLSGLKIKAVQSQSIGYDGVHEWLPDGIAYCNARGVHEASTAELAIALTLASLRGLPTLWTAQTNRRWAHLQFDSLADSRVLILGYGGVGQAIATRLRGFDVELIRVATTTRHDDHGIIHGLGDLAGLLPTADVVIIALPLTASTTSLVDADFLARMPAGALLVNVARGPIVDTAALTHAVRAGQLRAALDVTDPEPLPAEHPLWLLDGVIITPHVGGHSAAMTSRIDRLIRRQTHRLATGRPLLNQVYPRTSAE